MAKTVALALGSGGARGYAHIGIIQAIEARGYEIINVSGCSMGAIVGGFYAAGKLDEYTEWVSKLGYLDVLRMLDLNILSGGAIKLDKVYATIEEMLGGCQIEDLNLPFTAVATDLKNKKEIWFQNGSLVQAMRASAAIPTILAPVITNDMTLVDGAVLNPVPIAPCVSAHAQYIIAVDLNADVPMPDPVEAERLEKEAEAEAESAKSVWLDAVVTKASEWFGKNDSPEAREEADTKLGKIEILSRMFEVMQSTLGRFKIAAYPPDLLIRIPSDSCDMYEFYRAEEMIKLGRDIANQALDAFEQDKSSLYGDRLN